MNESPAPKEADRRRGSPGTFVTTAAVSARMSRIGQRDTAPELRVREIAAAMGLRYRTRNRDLPGSPDLANRTRKWAVFVHGCFWHHHPGCRAATVPKSNRATWQAKFRANRARDARVQDELKALGFAVTIVWECEARTPASVGRALEAFVFRPNEKHCEPARSACYEARGLL